MGAQPSNETATGLLPVTNAMRWRAIREANRRVLSGRIMARHWRPCYDGAIARQQRGEQS